jgi:hypothetical protein
MLTSPSPAPRRPTSSGSNPTPSSLTTSSIEPPALVIDSETVVEDFTADRGIRIEQERGPGIGAREVLRTAGEKRHGQEQGLRTSNAR